MVRINTGGLSALKKLSTSELRELLEARLVQERKRLPALQAKSAKLAKEMAKIDAEIAAIEGTAPAAVRPARRMAKAVRKAAPKPMPAAKRARAKGRPAKRVARGGGRVTLPVAIEQVLSEAGKPLSLAEIRDAIIRKKLLANISKSFPVQVAITLGRHREFKRVGKGIYSL
jgi:hypothetical protein